MRTTKFLRPETTLTRAAVPDEESISFSVESSPWYGVTSDWMTLYAESSDSSTYPEREEFSEKFESSTGGPYNRPGYPGEICCRLKTDVHHDFKKKLEIQKHFIEIHNCPSVAVHVEIEFRTKTGIKDDELFCCTAESDGFHRLIYSSSMKIDGSLCSSEVQKDRKRRNHIDFLEVRPLDIFGGCKRIAKPRGALILWGDQKFSDVLIVCTDNVSFKAHRLVLSANSGFFDKMLSSEFKEGRDQKIYASFPSSVMRRLLQFCYTGKCNLNKESYLNDLAAADFYQIEAMKRFCWEAIFVQYFCESSKGVLDLFVLASTYNNAELKNWTLRTIRKSDIKVKDVQTSLLCGKTNLLIELFSGSVS